MKDQLLEALECVNEMTADVNGEYPCGLIRVRHLLLKVLTEADVADDEERKCVILPMYRPRPPAA